MFTTERLKKISVLDESLDEFIGKLIAMSMEVPEEYRKDIELIFTHEDDYYGGEYFFVQLSYRRAATTEERITELNEYISNERRMADKIKDRLEIAEDNIQLYEKELATLLDKNP